MVYNAIEIANYLISKSTPGTSENITNLKLQKILYYAQGFHYATTNQKLFDDEIQAWVHGPVVPNVYHCFKKYNYREIPKPDTIPSIDPNTSAFLNNIWKLFKNTTGKQLEFMTHQETPWRNIRKDLPEYVYTSDEIPVIEISNYFKKHYLKTATE
jgi:uncharacterized phage-associated protein